MGVGVGVEWLMEKLTCWVIVGNLLISEFTSYLRNNG